MCVVYVWKHLLKATSSVCCHVCTNFTLNAFSLGCSRAAQGHNVLCASYLFLTTGDMSRYESDKITVFRCHCCDATTEVVSRLGIRLFVKLG